MSAMRTVDDAQDRDAVMAHLASSGVDAQTAGLTSTFDPTFELGFGLSMGPVAGLGGGCSTTSLESASPEYFDGNGSVPRTTC